MAVSGYYGEGNSKGRRIDFDFEYCVGCNLRLINGEAALTRDILEDEFEVFVKLTKKGKYVAKKEVTVQHSDFEVLERLIQKAIAFGKLK